MARDQIEYCGDCKRYSKCLELAKQGGRLTVCKANKENSK